MAEVKMKRSLRFYMMRLRIKVDCPFWRIFALSLVNELLSLWMDAQMLMVNPSLRGRNAKSVTWNGCVMQRQMYVEFPWLINSITCVPCLKRFAWKALMFGTGLMAVL